MFRPQIQKTSTLVLIAIFNLLMVYLSVNSKYSVKLSGYQDKVEATKNMIACIIVQFLNKTNINKHMVFCFSLTTTPVLSYKLIEFSLFWSIVA